MAHTRASSWVGARGAMSKRKLPLDGSEAFVGAQSGQRPAPTVREFWRWAMSDLLSNATRGVLAEFVVGTALGLRMEMRREWDAVDLVTAEGHRIEVKSAAYVQAWPQNQPSKIQFRVAPTLAWDPEQIEPSEPESRRQADVYVFALLAEKDVERADPLDLSQWQFFVVAAAQLNHMLGDQKTISLGRLKALAGPATDYSALADAVGECLASVAAPVAPVT